MSDRGLTLVEVLVALVVACVTMAATAHSAGAVRLGARDAELLEKASLLAGDALERRIALGPLGIGEESSFEAIDDPLGVFERHVEVDHGPRDNLWHVTVAVAPPRNRPIISVQSLLRRPWWSP
jgi:prepilin-type N-terminal cleavage/methylation domain-containing protein